MKKKITKIESHKNLSKRVAGYGLFRITGPCVYTKNRLTVYVKGTREFAESIHLNSKIYYQNQILTMEGAQ